MEWSNIIFHIYHTRVKCTTNGPATQGAAGTKEVESSKAGEKSSERKVCIAIPIGLTLIEGRMIVFADEMLKKNR